MHASTFMRLCIVWLGPETCSWAHLGESTLGARCSRHNETSSVFATVFTYSLNILASPSEDAASLEPTSPSCREDKFRHPCCDHTGECAFQGSVVARREVSVSMSSFCCSSHKQIGASTSLEAMSTHGTAQLLRRGVEFVALISRPGDTLRGSP